MALNSLEQSMLIALESVRAHAMPFAPKDEGGLGLTKPPTPKQWATRIVEMNAIVNDAINAAHSKEAEDVRPILSRLVDRFLGWKLPDTFAPDAGVSFKPYHPDQKPGSALWPVGTNLLSAEQAREMLAHVCAPLLEEDVQLRLPLEVAKAIEKNPNGAVKALEEGALALMQPRAGQVFTESSTVATKPANPFEQKQ